MLTLISEDKSKAYELLYLACNIPKWHNEESTSRVSLLKYTTSKNYLLYVVKIEIEDYLIFSVLKVGDWYSAYTYESLSTQVDKVIRSYATYTEYLEDYVALTNLITTVYGKF